MMTKSIRNWRVWEPSVIVVSWFVILGTQITIFFLQNRYLSNEDWSRADPCRKLSPVSNIMVLLGVGLAGWTLYRLYNSKLSRGRKVAASIMAAILAVAVFAAGLGVSFITGFSCSYD